MRDAGDGNAGLWIGGGYEGTHFWVDPKRQFVAVVLAQVFGQPSAARASTTIAVSASGLPPCVGAVIRNCPRASSACAVARTDAA